MSMWSQDLNRNDPVDTFLKRRFKRTRKHIIKRIDNRLLNIEKQFTEMVRGEKVGFWRQMIF
jgi:hypothetical protein